MTHKEISSFKKPTAKQNMVKTDALKKKFAPRSYGMHKLTHSQKNELFRAKEKIKKAAEEKTSNATVPIHREDPQAGYDQQETNPDLNGNVLPNPKDGREDQE